jgi:hypothetical protein
VFDNADNPLWDTVDRGRTIECVARFGSLKIIERRELFGALTAALWLGGGIPESFQTLVRALREWAAPPG